MTKSGGNKPIKLEEVEKGCVLYNLDPIIMKYHYEVDYIHSYAQDSPFFAGLANKKIKGSKCTNCSATYATPRSHCMECGAKTEWMELPHEGKVHTYTTCYFGGEEFLEETPFTLILVEWPGIDTFFLSRLVGVAPEDVYVGMPIRAKFKRLSQFKPTDVYFVPAE
ncbi:MAG TPA: Zn-ribbon domain-containing OB-fold protein [Candidatus Deferrimicrobium sp.]|nr:Zn-ribbon domain-containing OB-fold protein [Candidatus Deferrimicrobium sp.]